MYDEDWKTTSTSPETMLQTCRAEGVLFLVIVKSRHSQGVRVKSVLQRSETEGKSVGIVKVADADGSAVDLLELATWLDEALVEHRKAHGNLQGGQGTRAQHAKAPETASSARESALFLVCSDSLLTSRDASFQVLLPGDATRKLKHRSRQVALDRGTIARCPLTASAASDNRRSTCACRREPQSCPQRPDLFVSPFSPRRLS